MRKFLSVFIIGICFTTSIYAQQNPLECQENDDRKSLLLLGSYHMANPGLDKFNLEADDVKTSKRQQEIKNLVESLIKFQPTKVAVEIPLTDSSSIEAYKAYVEENEPLSKNESQQIGFRLAKLMGHNTIYPIDIRMDLNSNQLGKLASEHPELMNYLGGVQQTGQQAMQIMGKWLAEGTISEMLYNMNRPEVLEKAHAVYLEHFLPVVHSDNYAGADFVSRWYKRNIRIFSNLHKISDSESDRILVIYGQGHIPILKELTEDSPYFCLEDPLPYLKN